MRIDPYYENLAKFRECSITRPVPALAPRRLVTRFPFQAAAHAGQLRRRCRFARENGIGCGAHVRTCHRHSVPCRVLCLWPTVVKASTIKESASGVIQKEVGSAGGSERLGDLLSFVIKVREC